MIKDYIIPYGELDPPVVNLARAINEFPGIATRGSCGGGEGHMAGPGEWWVTFDIAKVRGRPIKTGWLSLEFLSWALYDVAETGRHVKIWPDARPPFLNTPGNMLYFEIRGHRGDGGGIEPDELADKLNEMRLELFTLD